MICFCDFNPRLIKEYSLDGFTRDRENTAQTTSRSIGTTGVTSAMTLKKLGENSKVLTCLGLENGKIIREYLENLRIDTDIVKLLDESVEQVKVTINCENKDGEVEDEENKSFDIISKTPRMTSATETEILSRINEISKEDGILVLNETDNLNLESDFYENVAIIAENNKKEVVASFRDEVLIKNTKIKGLVIDKTQLQKLTGDPISYDKDVVRSLQPKLNIYEMVVALGRVSAVFVSKDESYKLSIEGMEVSTLDKNLMLTGLALGLSKKYSLDTTLKLAFAISAFKNYKSENDVDMSDIKEIMNKVVLRRLN
ncbi:MULTISPECIES: PfkB family carbohydrate kinase [Peptoniphilus]|uniref:PfkB family carbohydrate kinase n=1 Tax=Peptoniphilus TaxID=162289 RepID=UPI0003B8CBCD|nr:MULTISPECIES: PfkB family carbohydrate kinase [Peptoniphilus]ERT64833.1 carbohydrate kinase, PfkB family [Peptoniphilus sp. BV3AC2]